MQLNNALFNWLQIEIVREARPSDQSAAETVQFFATLLAEDHQVTNLTKKRVDDVYEVAYQAQQQPKTAQFPAANAEKLLQDILDEPKYNQSFDAD